MIDSFDIVLAVTIRSATRDDLRPLEWYGLITPYRESIEIAWERTKRGENLFLVAEANRFPVGQVWVDLIKARDERVGVIWALRVFPPFQNLGIGARLISAAEDALRARGFHTAELGVGKDNPNAKRLYDRLGYTVIREAVERWFYTTPDGETIHVDDDEWIMRKPL